MAASHGCAPCPGPTRLLGAAAPCASLALVLVALSAWAAGCASLPANIERTASTRLRRAGQTRRSASWCRQRRAQARRPQRLGLPPARQRRRAPSPAALALIEGAQRSLDLQYYAIHADTSTEVLLQRAARGRAAGRARAHPAGRLQHGGRGRPGAAAGVRAERGDAPVQPAAGLARLAARAHRRLAARRRAHPEADAQQAVHRRQRLGHHRRAQPGRRLLRRRRQEQLRRPRRAGGRAGSCGTCRPASTATGTTSWPIRCRRCSRAKTWKSCASRGAPAKRQARRAAAGASREPVEAREWRQRPCCPTVAAHRCRRKRDRPLMDLRAGAARLGAGTLLVDEPGKIGPGDDEVDAGETVVDGLLNLMQQARQRRADRLALLRAGRAHDGAVYRQLRQRGVRVRVLTNSLASNDAPAAHAGYARYRKALLAWASSSTRCVRPEPARAPMRGGRLGHRGCGSGARRIQERHSRASLHSKAVIIDGRLAVIGSMNLDLRSQLKNSEVALWSAAPRCREAADRAGREHHGATAPTGSNCDGRQPASGARRPARRSRTTQRARRPAPG